MMVLKLSGNGSSLVIQNTSFSSINIVHDSFYLNKVFHYPQVATNLLSINQIYQDNDCYFIIIGIDFLLRRIRLGDCCSTDWLRIVSILLMGIRATLIIFDV